MVLHDLSIHPGPGSKLAWAKRFFPATLEAKSCNTDHESQALLPCNDMIISSITRYVHDIEHSQRTKEVRCRSRNCHAWSCRVIHEITYIADNRCAVIDEERGHVSVLPRGLLAGSEDGEAGELKATGRGLYFHGEGDHRRAAFAAPRGRPRFTQLRLLFELHVRQSNHRFVPVW